MNLEEQTKHVHTALKEMEEILAEEGVTPEGFAMGLTSFATAYTFHHLQPGAAAVHLILSSVNTALEDLFPGPDQT